MAIRGPWNKGGLVRSFATQHDADRLGHDRQIETQRPRVHIVPFHPDDFFEIDDQVSAGDLPGTGESRDNAETDEMSRFIARHFGGQWRPWADERHVTREHIETLRR